MSCVNTELKEFKDAVTRLDIHPDNLELVLHKFLNTEGWGDRFPTDEEILNEVKAKPFEAETLADIKYWMTMRYDQPMVYGNLQEALDAVSSVKLMLGDVAKMHRNSRGEYVVTVGTPRMSNLSLTLDNTLVDDLLGRIRETNPYHQLFKSIVDLVGKDNIKVRMGLNREHPQIEEDRNPAAYFPDRREIIFFPENMGWLGENVDTNNRSIFKIMAHELVHQMAYDAIAFGTTSVEAKFKREIESLYDEAKKAIGEEYFYGMTNAQEFIAEALTDARFQRRLAEIKSSKDKSLWQKLVDAFSAIFDKIGIKINGSVLADVLSATEEFMSNIGTEREQMAEEEALREEIFLSEMGEELGYESKTLNRVVSSYSNKISDYTYYMFATESGQNKRYAVNIPTNSQDTLVEAQDKVREMLREHGLNPDYYGISKEFKKFGGRDVLYVSPKRTKKSNTPTTSQSTVTETTVDNTPTFTDREKSFLDYLDDIRPDLARKVRDGLVDIGDLMLNEDEITLFAEPVELSEKADKIFSRFDFSKDAEVTLRRKAHYLETHIAEIRNLPVEVKDTVLKSLVEYMDKAGDGVMHEDLVNEYFSKRETTADKILKDIIYGTEDEATRKLAEIALKQLKGAEIKIKYSPAAGARGTYYTDGRGIVIRSASLKGTTREEAKLSHERTIIHEIIHAITVDKITDNRELRKEVGAIMSELKNYHDSNDFPRLYALKNEKEFVAEFMSRPAFREALKHLESKNKVSFFRRVLNTVLKALGIRETSGNTLYDNAVKAMEHIFDAEAVVTELEDADMTSEEEDISYYEGNITPSDDTIFVFGSNPEGRHGAGAAKTAHDQFGAEYGVGEGLTGNSYALPTKDLRVKSDGKIDETKLHELQSDEVLIDKFIKGRLGNYTIQDIEEGKVFSGFPKGVVQVQYSINHNVPAVVFEGNNGQRFLLEWDTRRNEFFLAKYNQEQDTYFHVASESRGETDEAIAATKRAVDKFLPKEFVDYVRNKAGEDSTKDADFYLEKFNIPHFSPTYEDKNGNTVYKFELRNSEFDNFIKQSLSNSLGNFSDRSLRSIPKETIVESIKKLYDTARRMPNKQFKVAYRNTDTATLNGYTGYEMMEMFREAGKIPANVVFSKEWVDSGNITTDDYYSADITPTTDAPKETKWARTSENSYEVSTQGDSRFSALKAKFKEGTIIDDVDVSGMTIENVYQSVIKKSGKGKAPSKDSKLFVDTTPKFKGKMSFAYGNQRADGVTATTTLDAIKRGERTATTRYTSDGNINYWKQAKVGDVIEFSGQNGEKVIVRVTKELHQLPKSTTAEEWSSKEGWDTSRFEERVKPQIDKGEAYQMEFEYIDQSKEAMEDFSYREGYLPLWQEWARQNPELIQELREKSAGKVLTDKFASTRVSQARALAEILNSEEVTSDLTDETESKLLEFSGEFEGASNNLVGIVPEPLLSKVEDYIMSGGQFGLSEADAQQFLNYAEQLYATQETTNQEGQTIKKENQNYMEKAVEITRQIDNLNNSTVLSATEIRHIAEQAVYWISDHITELQETSGKAVEIYDTDGKRGLKDKDFASMTRADVVRTIGPDNMIAMCKEKFSPENTDYEDFDTIEKAEVITDNWGAVMMLASDVFLSVEDFSIVSSKDGTTSEVNEDLVADADNFNQSNQESDVAETEGDQQEHWQVETKTLDVLATMSQMVRQALTKCYLLDKDGNNIKSEFGINERVNAREATNSILRWTQGALNLEQMVAKLNERADSNPWVRQLVERLSDTTGKESDFQGQFFGTFCKHFQPYSVVIEENGRYKSIQVNENPALSEAMTQVTTQYKIGEHPLFTNEGINKTSFSELKSAFEDLEKYNHQGYDLTDETTKMEAATTLGFLATMMGYTVIPEMVATNLNKDTFKRMYSAMRYIVSSLEKNLDNATYEPFKFGASGSINGNTREFLKPITDHLEDIAVSAFYDSGKMYQSYITPSYTSKLFQKFQAEDTADSKDFTDFLKREYDVPWFHTGRDMEKGWRNAWLRQLAKMSAEERKKMFRHKVQLNFNKHNYMKNMSDMEYALSMITEYFSEASRDTQAMVPAWFRVPMLSNKPSSEFIKFYSYRGSNYRDSLTNGFKEIFDQEMSRIQTVEMRNFDKKDSRFIKNFDTNGRKFCFLDFMNEYLTGEKKNSELGKLIRDKLDGKTIDEAKLNKMVKEVIRDAMEAKAEAVVSGWEAQGILEGAKKIANIGTTTEEIRENLKNFVWNDTFAAMNIMQLTITDIAYYKDAEDLQKRLAQIHAPGIRGNVAARDYEDYEGNLVTDGNFRTIKLADFNTFISNIIDNVSVVFDRKIEAAKTEGEKAALRALKDSLVGEEGSFRAINVTDAQGYSSPTSYRKKALVFGKWSRQAEEVYQKLKAGTYTYSDLQVAFQPLKPFVYSQITKDAGVDGVPLSKMKVPVQFKNSEYLLVMADAILQGENTGRPNLLRAIFEVMEESHYDSDGNYKTDGIDTVQFESTVKSGLAGKISLNDLINHPNGEALAKARMEASIYEHQAEETTDINPETGEEVKKTIYTRTGNYNNSAVDTVPMEDYCLQQEVPEHFKNHDQAHGSQLRYIIVSELETKTADGEDVTYNLEGRKVSAQEFKAEYEQTIADNIEESINELAEELSLGNIDNIKDRNIALSKILQREILSSPRYGIDLLQACSVDENGRFRIPLGDPIQSKRVEQLINSIIKNRINKQKIAGGPVVQVTNFGTSKELNIRFKDKNGDLLMTRAEYERNPIKREPTQAEKYNAKYKGAKLPDATMSYEDYIKENQAGIAYFEVFAPIYSNSLFTQFADHNGVINMEAIEILDPDLLKMIGYRIPTEDKYSMAPLKIVGFLPREAGDGIMLPNDITLLTGSDFDVDKEYLMRKDYGIKRNDTKLKDVRKKLIEELMESQADNIKKLREEFNERNEDTHPAIKALTEPGREVRRRVEELVRMFLDDPFDSSILSNVDTADGYLNMPPSAYRKLLKSYLDLTHTVEIPTEGRTYRNNKIVDMTYEVLTHETSADKMLNPGGFDPQKRMGYQVSVFKMPGNKYTWDELGAMSIDQLKKLNSTNKNLSYIDTHIQFYRQNSAAGALIGIFAVNRIAHAVLESGSEDGSSTYSLNVDNICKLDRNFRVAGMDFGGFMPFDMRYDRNGQLIGKVMGSLVASAADAVKDPVLNLMNINSSTANILNSLVRLGMPFDDAALFLSQSVISDILAEYSRENISGYKSLNKVIEERIEKLQNDNVIDKASDVNSEELTKEELIDGLKDDANPSIAYKTLLAFSNFQKIAEALRMPTFATRFNSMSSAVGPLIIDNLITEYKMQKLSLESNVVDSSYNPVDMTTIFLEHPILNQFQRTISIARTLFGNMPANSIGFRNILELTKDTPLAATIYGDRKLLSSLSDFYQSYLLMKSGVINPTELGETITEFPKEFMANKYKKKYPDNALIQAIKYGTDKSGRATLQVDITGLDTQQKERLSSGWIDLHKVDPELSIKLFKYNFFRGGIGFSPKTFMSLVPVFVKERIPGYVDTFRILPSITPEIVLDQFIRNNWDNNKLVPRKKVKVTLNEKTGNYEVTRPSDLKEVVGLQYFKTKIDNTDKLLMFLEEREGNLVFKEVPPLGSNKEYIEMSESLIDSPLNVPTTSEAEVNQNSEIAEPDQAAVDAEIDKAPAATNNEDRLNDLLLQILIIEGTRDAAGAEEYIKNYKAKSEQEKARMEKQTKKFFRARFEKLGIKFDEKLIDDVYKLIC